MGMLNVAQALEPDRVDYGLRPKRDLITTALQTAMGPRWPLAATPRGSLARLSPHPSSQSKPHFTRSISVICHFICFVSA